MQYAADVKSAILSAVKVARAAGSTWPVAHEAAVKVGYKGGMESLAQMLHKVEHPKHKRAILRTVARTPHADLLRSPTLAQAIEAEVGKRVSERVREFFRTAKRELGENIAAV